MFTECLICAAWNNTLVPNRRKEYVKAVYCHPAYLTSMQSTSWETLGWVNHKLESRLPGDILMSACASSSPAFHMMYSAYKLNKQGDNIQPWHTPFPIWNQSVVPCPVLTVASWPANRFLRRQVRWSDIPISFRIFHSLLWSTQSKALA